MSDDWQRVDNTIHWNSELIFNADFTSCAQPLDNDLVQPEVRVSYF